MFWCYLEQGVVYEDVLVLGLHHVVPLRPQAGHVPVHVHLDEHINDDDPDRWRAHRLLVLHPLEHGVDHDEGAGPAHAGATVRHHGPAVRGVEHVDASGGIIIVN